LAAGASAVAVGAEDAEWSAFAGSDADDVVGDEIGRRMRVASVTDAEVSVCGDPVSEGLAHPSAFGRAVTSAVPLGVGPLATGAA
jgi:hypothetical protein